MGSAEECEFPVPPKKEVGNMADGALVRSDEYAGAPLADRRDPRARSRFRLSCKSFGHLPSAHV